MAKARVYELAKELGVESKALMAKLNELGEFVRSASSTIEPPVVRRLRDLYPPASAAAGAGAGEGRQGPQVRCTGRTRGSGPARRARGNPGSRGAGTGCRGALRAGSGGAGPC